MKLNTDWKSRVFGMGEPKDSYDILGLSPGASPEEVKEAYIELAKVWRPSRFPNGDRLRPVAERKMAEIDAAYLTLKTFFRSNGHGRSRRNRKNAPEGSRPEGKARENRVFADAAGEVGRCEFCGKPSVPRELRYAIYCPSCGTLNYLKSKKDYHRGTCVECRAPFRVPVKLNVTTSRKVAYPVLLGVLLACVWFFFLSGGGGNYPPVRHPVSAGPPQTVLSNNLSAAMAKPPAPITSEEKQVPLPAVSTPAKKVPSPAAAVPAKTAPSPAATTPPHAASSPLETASSAKPPAGGPAPAVSGSGIAPKVPEKKVDKVEEVHPKSVQKKSIARYDELIEHILRQESMDSQKSIQDISVIPLNDSTVEHK